MDNSDIFSAIALIVSLFSLWLAYRSTKLTKNVSASEKRTQAHSILLGCFIEMQNLHRLVRYAVAYDGDEYLFPDGLESIEAKLLENLNKIQPRLLWLRSKTSCDPLVLEEYKSYALELESWINNVAPMISGLKAEKKNDS